MDTHVEHLASETLTTRAKAGDRSAFEELYRRYYPAVVARIANLLGPQAPTRDLAQDTFVRAFQKLADYRADAPFRHWVLRIATNAARSHYRRMRGHPWGRPDPDAAAELSRAAEQDRYSELELVHRALQCLSPRLREAVVLFELEGLTLVELSHALGISIHTAGSRVRRGREKLKARLERMGARGEASKPAVNAGLCRGEAP